MKRLQDLARQRVVRWLAASSEMNQTKLAAAVGVSQTWVSQFKTGDQDADLDQLDAIARAFGHTLYELLDVKEGGLERRLIEAFRAIPPEKRETVVASVELVVPDQPTRKRSSGRR